MEVMTPINVVRAPRRHEGRISVGLPDPSYRAFELLYFSYIAAAGCAGLGKVFGLLASWAHFVPRAALDFAGSGVANYVRAAGLCELALAGLIAIRPRLGGWLAAGWLTLGILDLLAIPGHYALAGCLATMAVGAVALAYLAEEFVEPTTSSPAFDGKTRGQ